MGLHGHLDEAGELAIRGSGKDQGATGPLVDPPRRDVGLPRHAHLDPAGVAEVHRMRLVVVLLFPFGIAESNALVDAAQFRADDAFDGEGGILEGVEGHAVAISLADAFSGHRAMDGPLRFNSNRLAHGILQVHRRLGVEDVRGAPCVLDLCLGVCVPFQLADVAFSFHLEFGVGKVELPWGQTTKT